jgi:hypothetical protein
MTDLPMVVATVVVVLVAMVDHPVVTTTIISVTPIITVIRRRRIIFTLCIHHHHTIIPCDHRRHRTTIHHFTAVGTTHEEEAAAAAAAAATETRTLVNAIIRHHTRYSILTMTTTTAMPRDIHPIIRTTTTTTTRNSSNGSNGDCREIGLMPLKNNDALPVLIHCHHRTTTLDYQTTRRAAATRDPVVLAAASHTHRHIRWIVTFATPIIVMEPVTLAVVALRKCENRRRYAAAAVLWNGTRIRVCRKNRMTAVGPEGRGTTAHIATATVTGAAAAVVAAAVVAAVAWTAAVARHDGTSDDAIIAVHGDGVVDTRMKNILDPVAIATTTMRTIDEVKGPVDRKSRRPIIECRTSCPR